MELEGLVTKLSLLSNANVKLANIQHWTYDAYTSVEIKCTTLRK